MKIPVMEFIPALLFGLTCLLLGFAGSFGPPPFQIAGNITAMVGLSYAWYSWWRWIYYAGAPLRIGRRR